MTTTEIAQQLEIIQLKNKVEGLTNALNSALNLLTDPDADADDATQVTGFIKRTLQEHAQ